MILSDVDIEKALAKKDIIVTPAPDFETQLGACSLDFRLGNEFRVFDYSTIPYIDFKQGVPDELTRSVTVEDGKAFTLQPGEFVLASTQEWLELPDNIVGRLEGRSSLGRIGIIVHATASVFEPGWKGNAVLELSNIARLPVALYPGMRVCAMSFETLSSPARKPYNKGSNAKYVDQKGTIASKIDSSDLK